MTLQALAQSELSNLINYFHVNNLVPNPTKTVYTTFSPRNQPFYLTVEDTPLKHKTNAPLLGFTIQSDLKHHTTALNIVRKLQPLAYQLSYANKFLTTKTLLGQYRMRAYPHLITGIAIWGTDDPQATYLQPLIRMQKRLVRLIAKQHRHAHSRPIMDQLNILSVPDLYTLRVSLEMHQYLYARKPANRPRHDHHYVWASAVHSYPTRHAQDNRYLFVPRQDPHGQHYAGYLTAKYANIWNLLPLEVRTCQSISKFKARLKDFLLRRARAER